MPRKIEISHRTIIFTVFFLIFLWFLYFVRDIILIFFISLILMAILNPLVVRLTRLKIPRSLSVIIVYLVLVGVLGGAIAGVIPPLVEQTSNFANGLPKYLANIGIFSYVSNQLIRELAQAIGSLPAQFLKVGISIFSNLLSVLSVLIFAFYLLVSKDKLEENLGSLLDDKRKARAVEIITGLEAKLGGWARGEIILMTLVGVMTFIGLKILQIPYALPLALLAGFLEIVPSIGPILSAIPLVIIGFGISPVTGIAALALAFLVQQVENYVFVPKVMEKSVGLNPIAVLLSLAVGFKLAGVAGVVISVPIFLTIQILIKAYLSSK
jgi:predicted PurR-regulated permease PerM